MTTDYAATWAALLPETRTRFLTRRPYPLSVDDRAALLTAGPVTIFASGVEGGTGTNQWTLSDGFVKFIAAQIEKRKTELLAPYVDEATVPLTGREDDAGGPIPDDVLAELRALDANLAELDLS
ncbi:hypothetical protein GXP71_08140 [Cellulomonas sp. H30R-01]|uniref:hypothetical protein n=1 Tax=Cellulomonas sp. H30R-01 TaxID=2704467 RepID=UPI00138D98D1|nr:hypothetical protein [Cellulomonas sp. H30R-01]QHT56051.1 hypothetical protein GXP71_08140 [Cellulomonas sp. H30R-01]